MKQTAPEQEHMIDHRARTHRALDPEDDLGVSETGGHRERWTSDEHELSPVGGLVLVLWVLASLIAEVEVLWWVFARMHGH